MLDRIVIVGAGRTAESLVRRLSALAPVTIVDNSDRALDELEAPQSSPGEYLGTPLPSPVSEHLPLPRSSVNKVTGDGTSRLLLEDLRGPPGSNTALVAATGDDRTNVEVCRLGSELEYRPIVGISIHPSAVPRYEAVGARPIVRATLLGDVVERALRYDGIAVASTIGLGKGDVLEVRVLPTSPFIGQPLMTLDPDRWRVAAIYRRNELVIPTGRTTIEADDRVLLVGDPEILPMVAEDLRVGVPDFPLRFGPNIVVFLPDGPNEQLDREAEILGRTTRAKNVVRVALDAPPKEKLDAKVQRALAADPGVVIADTAPRGLLDRVLGRSGRNGRLCDTVGVPVLFARGELQSKRIVFVVSPGMPHLRMGDVAIDLARMLDAPLVVEVVELPAFLGGSDRDAEQAAAGIVKRAELHRLPPTVLRVRGNPIAEVVGSARPDDMLVVTRARGQRDSFATPDLALRIALAAPCSTLVLTGAPK